MLTAKALPASKSISEFEYRYRSQIKGAQCEALVCSYYLEKSYQLVEQRMKTPFAEIDLVFKSPDDEIVLVEVKSLSSFDFLSERVSKNQKQRLMRAFRYFLTKYDRVRMELAVVSQDGELLIFDDVFG